MNSSKPPIAITDSNASATVWFRRSHQILLPPPPAIPSPPSPSYTFPVSPSRPISSLKFSPDGSSIAASSSVGTVDLFSISLSSSYFSVPSSPSLTLFGVHDLGVNDICYSDHFSYLASASDDSTVCVWDLQTGTPLRVFKGHKNHVFSLSFSPTNNLLASGSFDERVKLWDLRLGKSVKTIQAHSDPISSVQFSPNGSFLVSSSYDGLCRIWDSGSGQCLKTIYLDRAPPVGSARFTLNGKYLLASYLDSTIRLWDFERGKSLKCYRGHQNVKYCCPSSFAVGLGSDGQKKFIVQGDDVGRAFLFDVSTRRAEQIIEVWENETSSVPSLGHCKAIVGVTCHPMVPIMAAGSAGGKIQFFTHSDSENSDSMETITMDTQEDKAAETENEAGKGKGEMEKTENGQQEVGDKDARINLNSQSS